MDWFAPALNLLVNSAPLLPGAGLLRVALPVSWALVLMALVLGLDRGHRVRGMALGLALLLGVWALVPGPWSVSYWLGLAFQLPSLTSTLLCLAYVWVRLTGWHIAPRHWQGIHTLGWLGVGLGWLLLLDTLAVLPFSLYPGGFGSAGLAMVAAVLGLLWWRVAGVGSVLLLAVLALFVVTRLPTGNLWDALLDPGLWVLLHITGLRTWLARRRGF